MLAISNAISATELKTGLVPFITAGYPNLNVTSEVIQVLDSQNVQAIEVGIPYSDALADGPIIQESSRVALAQNTNIDRVLLMLSSLRESIKTPIVIFTYLNPVLSKGTQVFIKEIAQSGVKGLIIPDLPLEESSYFIDICKYYDIELILFISPASSQKRVHQIVSKAPGCIYLVSSYGVTGSRKHFRANIQSLVKSVKSISNKRIMLGFGISNELQVASIMNCNIDIDAIVIGTAFIKCISHSCNSGHYAELSAFCRRLQHAISSTQYF